MGTRGNPDPHEHRTVRSYVAAHATGVLAVDEAEYEEFAPATVTVLRPERTLVEKLSLVHHLETLDPAADLCNSGQHATFFAARSTDPGDNMPHVRFLPQIFYFPAGGASVQHLAAPGEMTFARLTRKDGRYWMAILRGESIRFGDERDERYMRATTWEWPHLFARFETSAETFLRTFAANHIHGVYGDLTAELVTVCRALGVTPVVLDRDGAHAASTSGLPQI